MGKLLRAYFATQWDHTDNEPVLCRLVAEAPYPGPGQREEVVFEVPESRGWLFFADSDGNRIGDVILWEGGPAGKQECSARRLCELVAMAN